MIVAAVLAAGEGRRLGRPKALGRIGDRSLLEIVAGTCAASLADETVLVLGAGADEALALAARALGAHPQALLRIVTNGRWKEGRTGSVQAAWASSPEGSDLLVFPVDHPAVRLVTLDALFGVFGYAAGQPDVVVPVVSGEGRRRRGHPVLLSHRLRDRVLALGPDEPLHDVVHDHEVLEVPVDDPGILLDVDEPGDLERARELIEKG